MASSNDNIYDIVIVGGGTSGLVLASRLSEDLQLQVVVLEAGEDLTADPRVLTPAMAQTLWKTPSDWNLKTVAQVSCPPVLAFSPSEDRRRKNKH